MATGALPTGEPSGPDRARKGDRVSDDRPTLETLGTRLRPLEESLIETVTWLAEAGHLPARNAGRLAPTPRG